MIGKKCNCNTYVGNEDSCKSSEKCVEPHSTTGNDTRMIFGNFYMKTLPFPLFSKATTIIDKYRVEHVPLTNSLRKFEQTYYKSILASV